MPLRTFQADTPLQALLLEHALLLARGRMVAAGPVGEVLTGPLLSRTFGLPLVVEEREGRYSARAALT